MELGTLFDMLMYCSNCWLGPVSLTRGSLFENLNKELDGHGDCGELKRMSSESGKTRSFKLKTRSMP